MILADFVCTNLTKHTPGPWKLVRGAMGWFITAPSENGAFSEQTIAEFREVQHGAMYKHRAEQDARLFAAAPDMLYTLEYLANNLEAGLLKDSARAAIAKATGE